MKAKQVQKPGYASFDITCMNHTMLQYTYIYTAELGNAMYYF